MLDDALQLDNRDGRRLGHLEIIQMDRPESTAKPFETYEKILLKLLDYEKVSLKFLLGDKRQSPPTDLLIEALAISGNYKAIRKAFNQDESDEELQQFQAKNPNHSVKVELLRKKLFILAESLTPGNMQKVINKLGADGNLFEQIEIYFESLIKADKLSLERLKQVLLDLKLPDLYKMFNGKINFCLAFCHKINNFIADSTLTEFYKMDPGNVGTCIIINQKLYKGLKLKSRLGTDLDCSRLQETFTMLGYQVVIFSNVTLAQMARTLKGARDEIRDDCSSLVVCILAHGRKGAAKIKRRKLILTINRFCRSNHLHY
jgi:hypothetical protein